MAVITTGAHPKELWPGIKAFSGKTYKEKPIIAEMVFDTDTSDKGYEEYVEDTALGLGAIKPEGASVRYDSDMQGYTTRLTNVTYALGAVVTMEAIADNQYEPVARRKAAKIARSMRHTKEIVFANILNNAFSSSYVGGDGVELCATNHPTAAGNKANEPSIAADFSEAALEDALTAIRGFTDSKGLRIQASAQKLIVPKELAFEVQRILGSTLQAGSANNDINAIKAMGLMSTSDIVVWDFLTDPDAWFIKTDVPTGLIMLNRMGYELSQDNDFDTMNARMKGVMRFAGGWHDWRGIWGSPGA